MAYLELYKKYDDKAKARKEERKNNYDKSRSWIWSNCYNTGRWRRLRASFMASHPLCEECLKRGLYIPSKHCHHKNEISNGKDEREMLSICFDESNLSALCAKCHTAHHNEKYTYNYFLFEEDNKPNQDEPTV